MSKEGWFKMVSSRTYSQHPRSHLLSFRWLTSFSQCVDHSLLSGHDIEDAYGLLAKAQQNYRDNNLGDAIRDYEATRKYSILGDPDLYQLAYALMKTGEFDEAMSIFHEVEANDERSVHDTEAGLRTVEILYLEGKIEDAREKFTEVRKKSSELVNAYLGDKEFLYLAALIRLDSTHKQ